MRRLLVPLLLLAPANLADDAVDREDRAEFDRLLDGIFALRDTRWRDDATDLRRAWERGAGPIPAHAKVEVHGVALRAGAPRADDDVRADRRPGGTATVRVTRTGCRVVLVLAAYNAVEWTVEAADGVVLDAVLVSGSLNSTVRGVPQKRVGVVGRAFAVHRRDAKLASLESAVARRADGRAFVTYVHRDRADAQPIEVGPGARDWHRQMLLASMRSLSDEALRATQAERLQDLQRFVFPAVMWMESGRRFLVDATVAGPIRDTARPVPGSAQAAAVDPDTGRVYYLSRSSLEEYDADGRRLASIGAPACAGDFRFLACIAFDTRRRRVVVGTIQGLLAAFDVATREWHSVRGIRGADRRAAFRIGRTGFPCAMAYDARRDLLLLLRSNGRDTWLERVDALGAERDTNRLAVAARIPPGGTGGATLHVIGEELAVLLVEGTGFPRATSRCLVVDPESARIRLTEKLQPLREPPRLGSDRWPRLWDELEGLEPYAAMWFVAHADEPLLGFLRARWDEEARPDEREIARAIDDLDAASAAVRSRAYATLARCSSTLVPRLDAEIGRLASPEARFALAQLIEEFRERPDRRARLLRALRDARSPAASALRRALAGE